MIDRIAALVADESKWLPLSMAFALAAVAFLLRRSAASGLPVRRRVLGAMNLFTLLLLRASRASGAAAHSR